MGTVQIKIKDNGYTNRVRAIASLDGKVKAKVGVQGNEASEQHDAESGMTVAALGAVHEFGLGVPERSFIRAWFDENKKEIDAHLQAGATAVVAGKMTVYEAQEQFGEWAQSQIIARIGRGIGPPNSPATEARKGHGIQLVDTEKLLRAISHLVARSSQ
jgi:hypothetical protein